MTITGSTAFNLRTLTPAEVDAAWQEALKPARALEARVAAEQQSIERRKKEPRKFDDSFYGKTIQEAYEALNDLREELDEAYLAEAPFKDEWDRRGGWRRYYLVAGGKLHDYSCSTLTPGRTLIGLLCEASGLEPAEAIDKYDVTVCSRCWPEAPVEPKLTPEQEGFCRLSGESVFTPLAEPYRRSLEGRYGKNGWGQMYVAPGARCPECGGFPTVTKADKIRKHKRGTPK